MSSNKVILIGCLGRDPEVRYTSNGEAVCNFSVVTSEAWNDRNGQRVECTERHNITMYHRSAEIAGQYLREDSQAYLKSRIQNRKYQGKDGIEHTAHDIIVNKVKMLGGRNDNSGGAPYDDGYQHQQGGYQQARQQQCQSAPAYQQEAPSAPPAVPRRQAPVTPTAPVEDIGDDIPL